MNKITENLRRGIQEDFLGRDFTILSLTGNVNKPLLNVGRSVRPTKGLLSEAYGVWDGKVQDVLLVSTYEIGVFELECIAHVLGQRYLLHWSAKDQAAYLVDTHIAGTDDHFNAEAQGVTKLDSYRFLNDWQIQPDYNYTRLYGQAIQFYSSEG